MANKPVRGRIPLREQMLQHRAVMLAMCPDQEARDRLMRELPEIADKKVRATRKPSGNPSEAEILKSIMRYLRLHPKVAIVGRFNSGTFKEGNRYIRANSIRGMSDIDGMLVGGRKFALEVKSKTGRPTPDQIAYLQTVRDNGGIGEVVRSVDDVMRILNEA